MAPTCRLRGCSNPLATEPARVELCEKHKCDLLGCPNERANLEGGMYCRKHKCKDWKCPDMVPSDDEYCDDHVNNACQYEYGCDEHIDVTNWSGMYCPDHTCSFEACYESKLDADEGDYCTRHTCRALDQCPNGVTDELDAIYCHQHECGTYGCQTRRDSNSTGCSDHGCQSPEDCDGHVMALELEYCRRHGCHFGYTDETPVSSVPSVASSMSSRSASYSSVCGQGQYCNNHSLEEERYCEEHKCGFCSNYVYMESMSCCRFCACRTYGCPNARGKWYCGDCACNESGCDNLAVRVSDYEYCYEHFIT
ncbi:hypothetical protein IQ07DRAFT_150724 [Pyrenochaeta sp. DS3sAY3a]|nr:hypothetical protein IQ07DRAFT_150724 [Pyrenochaeta sp. DS3sAY3a]